MTDTTNSDVRAIRESFPFLDGRVYMNTAAVGLCPKGLGAAAAGYYDEVRGRGYEARNTWRRYEHHARERLARLLRVSSSVIEFTGSTTESLNLVAQSMRLSPGDRIVFPDDDFPSVRLAWTRHAANGVELVPVSIPSEAERTVAVAAAVDERTRAVCISHVHWNTGTRVNLAKLADVCARHDARLIVDGAQAAGAVDVDASCADVYAASTFKWLLADFGLAFLVVKGEFLSELEPVFRGYANESPAASLQYAHINHSAIGLLDMSLDYLETIGWPLVLQRVDALAELLHENLEAAGWDVVTPRRARAGIVTVAHPEAATLAGKLAECECFVEARHGLLRFSPHFYNDEGDVSTIVDSLGRIRRGTPP